MIRLLSMYEQIAVVKAKAGKKSEIGRFVAADKGRWRWCRSGQVFKLPLAGSEGSGVSIP